MINGDDYQRGFKDGAADAKADPPKPRNFNKMGLSWKYWGGMFLEIATLGGYDPEYSLNTYIEGYKEGYNQTLKAQHTVQQVAIANPSPTNTEKTTSSNFNTTKPRNTMHNDQDYEIILRQLRELDEFLADFSAQMSRSMEEYSGRLDELRKNGLAVQMFESFKGKHERPTGEKIEELKAFIERESRPYVDEHAQKVENAIRGL